MNKFIGIMVLLQLIGTVGAQNLSYSLGSQPIPQGLWASLDGATAVPGSSPSSAVDLSSWFPKPGYQGNQNSCVGWAVAYGTKSYQENYERNWGTDAPGKIFSPAFIYNQINGGRDAGSSLVKAVDLIKNIGAATFQTMPYDPEDFKTQPSDAALAEASQYPAQTYEVLDAKNIDSIKAILSSKNPVIIGMKISENFMTYKSGVYSQVSGSALGGHAMVVVGFDDQKKAFKILNSWSDKWGEKGYAWVDFQVFASTVHTAVVMKDQAEARPDKVLPPSQVQASQGSFQDHIEVLWENVPGALSYQIYRSENPKTPFTLVGEVQGRVFIDTKLKPATFYYYSVKSVGPIGPGEFSSLVQGFLQPPQGVGIPTGLQSQTTGTQVRLLWIPVDRAELYRIYRFNEGSEKYTLVGTARNSGFQDLSLEKMTASYWYIVTAKIGEKESPASEPISVTVTQKTIKFLQAPRVRASQGTFTDKIELTWPPIAGAETYELLKYNPVSNRWISLGSTQTTTFIDRNPGKGAQYYGVTALNETLRSVTTDYIEGFTSDVPLRSKKKYSDDNYFGTGNRDQDFSNPDLFSSSRFFADSNTYFDNFVPKDFFMVDTEKFFRVNPDFFKVDEKFFQVDEDFFH